MKTLCLVLLSFACYSQDSTYTLPLSKARLLFHDAIRSYTLDSLLSVKYYELDQTHQLIDDLRTHLDTTKTSYEKILLLNRQNNADQNRIIVYTRQRADKAEKGLKFWKTLGKILAGAVAVETIIIIAK